MGRLPLLAAAAALVAPAAHADAEFGRWLSSECVTCHLLEGPSQGVPTIVGWPQDVFVQVMEAYRSGERQHDVMNTIAGRYDDEEIAALAAYFEEAGAHDALD
jgi:cytochrome c553